MLVQTFPKPKIKKHRAKNNPKPTIEDRCRYCDAPYAQTHEVFGGNGKRQISIKYGMQAKLCWKCHEELPRDPQRNLELKQEYQRIFESKFGHAVFMKLFGRDYLHI